MIGLIGRWSAKVSEMSLAARCAWLNGWLAVVLAICLAVAAAGETPGPRIAAVLTAAAVCTVAANAALIPAVVWHGTPNGVAGALGGSLLGMFPPLAAGLYLHKRGGELAAAGVFGWIVVFYLAALTAKTLLVAPAAAKPVAPRPADADDSSCRAGV